MTSSETTAFPVRATHGLGGGRELEEWLSAHGVDLYDVVDLVVRFTFGNGDYPAWLDVTYRRQESRGQAHANIQNDAVATARASVPLHSLPALVPLPTEPAWGVRMRDKDVASAQREEDMTTYWLACMANGDDPRAAAAKMMALFSRDEARRELAPEA